MPHVESAGLRVSSAARLARQSELGYGTGFVIRPIAAIVAAILLSRPDMPEAEAVRYARVLQAEARARDFDPYTGVSIIYHESGWLARLVSPSGEDYGLGQIRARYVGACRDDDDPLGNPSPACRKVKESLLRGEDNIREMAALITQNREFCRDKVRSARFARWLASYQGRNYPRQNRWCKPGDKTWAVIKYRRWLISEVPKRLQAQRRERAGE